MSTSWKKTFNLGISSFQAARFDDALAYFTQATKEQGGEKQYIVYDSRAAAYERLERHKDALLDAKTVITLAPDQWHGYARAARLFLLARKFDASLKMANMALCRIKPHNTKRRVEIEQLRQEALRAPKLNQEYKPLAQNYIGKLPVELLGEVLHLVVGWNSAYLITVLHICRQWRDIIFHTPSLWEKLVLTQRAPIQKLRLWLKHSNDKIRELHITEGAVRHLDWPFKDLEAIPWHNLRVCRVESWDVAKYLERSTSSDQNIFAQLEELVIDNLHDVSPSPSLYPLLQASSLRSLECSRTNFPWKIVFMYLQNLTHLKVVGSCTDVEYLLPTLEANSSLTTFAMNTQLTFKWRSTQESPLFLPNLNHIEFAGSWASSLLEVIAMPALEVLHVRGAGGSLDRALTDAAPRSSHLQQLSLNHCSVTPSVVVALIQQTPCLTTLELMSLSKGANHVVEALVPSLPTSQIQSEKSDLLCPALTHLNLSHSPDVKTGPLVRLVKARTQSNDDDNSLDPEPSPSTRSVLLSLVIDGCEQIEVDWVPWFRNRIPFVSCVYQTKKQPSWRR